MVTSNLTCESYDSPPEAHVLGVNGVGLVTDTSRPSTHAHVDPNGSADGSGSGSGVGSDVGALSLDSGLEVEWFASALSLDGALSVALPHAVVRAARTATTARPLLTFFMSNSSLVRPRPRPVSAGAGVFSVVWRLHRSTGGEY